MKDRYEEMITVTKPHLPPLEDYVEYLKAIWERKQLTNNGPLLNELEAKLREFLEVKHCLIVSSGTMALQLAVKGLQLKGEVITTPFSFVATTSSIMWEHCKPVFVDIDRKTLNINPSLIEMAITSETSAILVTHVFGNPCNVDMIKEIADRYRLKIIYDAAHAFGVKYKGHSLLSYGDVSTLSLHATKIFSTAEGGAIFTNNDEIAEQIRCLRNFGYESNELGNGINGKNSELHAAFGLCTLDSVPDIIQGRKTIFERYNDLLAGADIERPILADQLKYNYSYYPILFSSEEELLRVKDCLNHHNILTRRYFHPSLNQLKILQYKPMAVSEDIASRILCLPLYDELTDEQLQKICSVVGGKVDIEVAN